MFVETNGIESLGKEKDIAMLNWSNILFVFDHRKVFGKLRLATDFVYKPDFIGNTFP